MPFNILFVCKSIYLRTTVHKVFFYAQHTIFLFLIYSFKSWAHWRADVRYSILRFYMRGVSSSSAAVTHTCLCLPLQAVKETRRQQGQEEQAGVAEVHGVSSPREGRADIHRRSAAQPVSGATSWPPHPLLPKAAPVCPAVRWGIDCQQIWELITCSLFVPPLLFAGSRMLFLKFLRRRLSGFSRLRPNWWACTWRRYR